MYTEHRMGPEEQEASILLFSPTLNILMYQRHSTSIAFIYVFIFDCASSFVVAHRALHCCWRASSSCSEQGFFACRSPHLWLHHIVCGILVSESGIKPMYPAPDGEVLTTGPPGMSLHSLKTIYTGLRCKESTRWKRP